MPLGEGWETSAPGGRLLLGVTDGPLSPSSRVRVFEYIPFFERAGYRCSVLAMRAEAGTRRKIHRAGGSRAGRLLQLGASWVAAQWYQLRLLRAVRGASLVLLHRIPISGWARPLLVPYRDRIVFDFDDAWYDAEGESLGPVSRLRRTILRRSLENAVAISRLVITSNRRNAGFVESIGGVASVVPTSVDTGRIVPRSRPADPGRPLVIGWIGTPSTARYLAEIEAVLADACRRHAAIVRLVGADRTPFRALDADIRPWSLTAEADELAGFDVGIMPMPDTGWTRGKAAFKALLYAAAGIPAVASWTPTNEEILGENAGAILCRSPDDWTTALDRLSIDGGLRARLGERGRALVVSSFSYTANAPRLLSQLQGTSRPPATTEGAGDALD